MRLGIASTSKLQIIRVAFRNCEQAPVSLGSSYLCYTLDFHYICTYFAKSSRF